MGIRRGLSAYWFLLLPAAVVAMAAHLNTPRPATGSPPPPPHPDRARYTRPMTSLLARLLYLLAAAVGRLPWPVLRVLADALAWLWLRTGARESVVALRNLELAYPELSPAQRALWHRAVLRTTALQTLDTFGLWTRPHARNLETIVEVHGEARFDAALAEGRGLIVAAPHFGNWELLNQWLAAKTPLAILYKPPESAVGEAFLRLVRADADADRVTQVRAEGAGVRQLYKRLQAGGVVGILPDQQPKGGDGAFAPFFEVQALTMLDILLTPKVVSDAWSYFNDVQTRNVKYQPFIRPQDQPPIWLNADIMARYREQMKKFYYDPSRYSTYLEQLGITYPTVRDTQNR